jgi:two-component system, NarL family, nitrate/nitrite response regulator NarL
MSILAGQPIRLLICANDLLVRAGLGALLATEPMVRVVGQLAPAADLAAQLTIYQPEVIVWDLGWATVEDVERLAATAEEAPPIIALVAGVDEGASLWTAGASGILLRDITPAALVAAIGAVMHNLTVFEPSLLPVTRLQNPNPADVLVESLTAREMEVLQAVAQGLSNKLIARQLTISEHTVKFHLNAILGKLGAHSRTDAVVRATRAGLLRL